MRMRKRRRRMNYRRKSLLVVVLALVEAVQLENSVLRLVGFLCLPLPLFAGLLLASSFPRPPVSLLQLRFRLHLRHAVVGTRGAAPTSTAAASGSAPGLDLPDPAARVDVRPRLLDARRCFGGLHSRCSVGCSAGCSSAPRHANSCCMH
ncbi:hypothetical protein F4808DRAFT_420158 [Astrocystis sublimbata]|nr:hypothetical protein F4808DRAFT_420158 [Astrocystis sublimbata]